MVTPSPSIRPKPALGDWDADLSAAAAMVTMSHTTPPVCAARRGSRVPRTLGTEQARAHGGAAVQKGLGPSSIGPRCLFSAAINCRPSKGKWSICVLVQHQFITLGSSWLALTTSKSWNRATNGLLRAQVRVPSRQRIARSLARMLI